MQKEKDMNCESGFSRCFIDMRLRLVDIHDGNVHVETYAFSF